MYSLLPNSWSTLRQIVVNRCNIRYCLSNHFVVLLFAVRVRIHQVSHKFTLFSIVGGWPWQTLGAIRAVATVWEAGEILFLFRSGKWRMISPISRRPNFTKFEHNNVDRCRDENFRNRIFFKFFRKRSFFQKTQKFHPKFQCLVTSPHHNYAMITDHRKSTAKWSIYGMSSFHFCR